MIAGAVVGVVSCCPVSCVGVCCCLLFAVWYSLCLVCRLLTAAVAAVCCCW